jgi:hypothetical protein
MHERVEIPAYTDRWMMGDRYGTVLSIRQNACPQGDVWRVKLDKSGKVVRVVAVDCKVL